MTREKLLEELSIVSELIAARPWWQRNLLDEAMKSTCDEPRQIIGLRTQMAKRLVLGTSVCRFESDRGY